MRLDVVREISIEETARVLQARGIFDVQPSPTSREEWHIDFPIEDRPWSVGLIHGPSGSGKSTLAREAFGDVVTATYPWRQDHSLLDDFPADMSIRDVTMLLSSVGFSSPPQWLRPFHVLSTGQQFRVSMARALAENADLTVVDEFTSVVDRTVAQVGSHAIAKTVRRRGQRFVAVSCHVDVLDWLQPDWTLDMADHTFTWRSLQRRPAITLTIQQVDYSAWDLFKRHHYLTADLHRAAHCYVASLPSGEPVAFIGVIYFPHPKSPARRISRLVILPDYQGLGLTVPFVTAIARIYAARGEKVTAGFAHPALVATFRSQPGWRLYPRVRTEQQRSKPGQTWGGTGRPVWRIEYTGDAQR